MEKTLRPYQQKAIDAINNALIRGVKSQLLVLPTGTGKTWVGAKAIAGKGRTCWCVHTEELAEQGGIALLLELEIMPADRLISTIKEEGGLIQMLRSPKSEEAKFIASHIGIIKADLFDIHKPIVVASMQTLYRRLDRIPKDHFKVIVPDEADLYCSKSFREPLTFFDYDLMLGLTATPFRFDNLPLEDLFSETVFEYTMKDAVRDGYLTKPIVVKLKTSTNLDDVHTLAGEFNQKELTQKVNSLERNNAIVNAYIEHGEGRQFIAFTVDVQHAIDLCEAFNEKGVKCGYVVGDKELTPDRRGVLDEFHSGELTGLTNVMILSVGYDYADIGVEIMARPTKSKRLYIQQLGRGLRLKSEKFLQKWKQSVIIIDVVDGTTKHRLINTDELDRDVPLEDKLFISDVNRQKLMDAKLKREQMMNVVARDKDEIIELFPLPKPPKFKMTARHLEPATEEQLKGIQRFGYPIENVSYTKAQVQEIYLSQMAAKQDVENLTGAGYDTSRGVTMIEAKLAYADLIERDKLKNIKK